MKQWMWTIEINTPPARKGHAPSVRLLRRQRLGSTREELKRRQMLDIADKLYAVVMALACTAALALAAVGIGYLFWEGVL